MLKFTLNPEEKEEEKRSKTIVTTLSLLYRFQIGFGFFFLQIPSARIKEEPTEDTSLNETLIAT